MLDLAWYDRGNDNGIDSDNNGSDNDSDNYADIDDIDGDMDSDNDNDIGEENDMEEVARKTGKSRRAQLRGLAASGMGGNDVP